MSKMISFKELLKMILFVSLIVFLCWLAINLTNGYFSRKCKEKFGNDFSYVVGRNHFCVDKDNNLKLLNK